MAEETGLELEVIDRETEARLAVAGARPLIAPDAARVLLFDIGGGSTEVRWLTRRAGQLHDRRLDLAAGGRRDDRRALRRHRVTPECFAAMRGHVRPMLREFVSRVAAIDGCAVPDHMLGTSGTVTTIAASIWRCGVMIARGSTAAGCTATKSGASPAISWP